MEVKELAQALRAEGNTMEDEDDLFDAVTKGQNDNNDDVDAKEKGKDK